MLRADILLVIEMTIRTIATPNILDLGGIFTLFVLYLIARVLVVLPTMWLQKLFITWCLGVAVAHGLAALWALIATVAKLVWALCALADVVAWASVGLPWSLATLPLRLLLGWCGFWSP